VTTCERCYFLLNFILTVQLQTTVEWAWLQSVCNQHHRWCYSSYQPLHHHLCTTNIVPRILL